MSAPFENHETSAERGGGGFGRRQRDRILSSVYDQGRNRQPPERWNEIEITETRPDALLDPTDNAKRGEVMGARRVGEVASDAQLEAALAIGSRVAFSKARLRELAAKRLDGFALLASREFGLELRPVLSGDRGGINQHQG